MNDAIFALLMMFLGMLLLWGFNHFGMHPKCADCGVKAAPHVSEALIRMGHERDVYHNALTQIIRMDDPEAIRIAHQAITPFTEWTKAGPDAERALNAALRYAASYGEQVERARREGWYRDTVPMHEKCCDKTSGEPCAGCPMTPSVRKQ
jgi:hypothetical protein